MKTQTAHTFQSRLLFRIATDPTAAARALRAVLDAHRPTRDLDRPDRALCEGALYPAGAAALGNDGRTCVDGGVDDRPATYPCATVQHIALELGVPIPDEPVYGVMADG